MAQVNIKASKTDPCRKGISIYIGRTNNGLCLVAALAAYFDTVHNLSRKDHRHHLEDITKDLIKNPRPFWRWLKETYTCLEESYLLDKRKLRHSGNTFDQCLLKRTQMNVWNLKEELMSTRSEVKIEELAMTEDEVCEELR